MQRVYEFIEMQDFDSLGRLTVKSTRLLVALEGGRFFGDVGSPKSQPILKRNLEKKHGIKTLQISDKHIPIPAQMIAPVPGNLPVAMIVSAKRNPNQLETIKVNRKDVHMRVEVIGWRISETMNANGVLAIMQKRNIARIDLVFGGSINGASI